MIPQLLALEVSLFCLNIMLLAFVFVKEYFDMVCALPVNLVATTRSRR